VGGPVGSLTGALVGMDIPEYEAKRYEGGILLSVHSDSSDETKRAKEVLKRTEPKIFLRLAPRTAGPRDESPGGLFVLNHPLRGP
jgi:hypothetical protein